MRVDFSQIVRDAYGNIEHPTLILKKAHDEIIGPLNRAYHLSMDLKYSDVSTAQFEYPYMDNGVLMPFYGEIVKDKIIEIDPFGVFIVDVVEDTTDGVQKKIVVELKSREYELSEKHLVLAEGVYRLCLPNNGEVSDPQEDTLMSYILEASPGWSAGYVSPTLYTKYRKMPHVDEQVLNFLQGTVQESYGCVVVFDSYSRSISLIDVDEAVARLPIYLSYENLLSNGTIKQLSEPITTKLYVQGADGVDIRNVNPTGDSYLYNLDWYIERGDLPQSLVQRWVDWQNEIFLQQPSYSSSVAARNTLNAQKITAEADLTELKNDRASESNLLDVSVAAKALAKTGAIDYDEQIKEHQDNIDAIDEKIEAQVELIEDLKVQINEINDILVSINNRLRVTSYFTPEELNILNCYFKEGSFQDTTFAFSDTSNNTAATYLTPTTAQLTFSDATIEVVKRDATSTISVVRDGKLNISGIKDDNGNSLVLSSDNIVSATIQTVGTALTVTVYAAPFMCGATKHDQCNVTVIATVTDPNKLFDNMTGTEIAESSYDNKYSNVYMEYTGTCSINMSDVTIYTTQSATDYQKYSVQLDLYEYAEQYLKDQAYPLCEFEVECANFLMAPEYDTFKDRLQLGCGCYLDLDDNLMLYPTLIEIHLDFDDSNIDLVFSNSFRRRGDVERLKDVIRDASSASRSYESMRNQYGITGDYVSWVHNLLSDGLDTAKTQILAGVDNTVTADGSGLTVDSQSGDTCIRLNNGMIALFDKQSNTVKMAMGRFYNEATSEDYVGVLADVIGGTLLAGKNLIIECPSDDGGVMQFKVDSTGVVVNNGRWHMKSNEGCIALDPQYGFMAGSSSLFVLSDEGKIVPTCVDSAGDLILDKNGFPEDVNVWIGIDGQVYVRGKIYATDGEFTGKVTATSGIFKGTVQADQYLDSDGSDMMANGKWKANYLDLGNIVLDGESGDIEMSGDIVMESNAGDKITIGDGNITLDGNIILKGNISWASANTPVKYKYSAVDTPYTGAGDTNWHDTMADSDLYKIESIDGGATWSAPYQFRNLAVEYMYSKENTPYNTKPSAWHTTMTSDDIYRIESHDGGKTWSAPYQFKSYSIIYQYSATGGTGTWHDVMDAANDYFRRESEDGGKTWGPGYQFRGFNGQNGQDGQDGQDGKDGKNGSDANVTYDNIKRALNRADNAAMTIIDEDEIETVDLYAHHIYGGQIFAGSGDTSATYGYMTNDSFALKRGDLSSNSRAALYASDLESSSGTTYEAGLVLGAGSDARDDTKGRMFVKKYISAQNTGQADCVYYTSGNQKVGFTFHDDGTIEVHGSLHTYLTFS